METVNNNNRPPIIQKIVRMDFNLPKNIKPKRKHPSVTKIMNKTAVPNVKLMDELLFFVLKSLV